MRNAHRACELGHCVQRCVRRRRPGGVAVGVDDIVEDAGYTFQPSEVGDECSVWVVGRAVGEVDEEVEYCFLVGDWLYYGTAPKGVLRVQFRVESCDDAEVVGSAFERFEEIAVLRATGYGGRSICEDDLDCFEIVTGKAVSAREEGYSTC